MVSIVAILRKQLEGEELSPEELNELKMYESQAQEEGNEEEEKEPEEVGTAFGGESNIDVALVRFSSGAWENDDQYEVRMSSTRNLLLGMGSKLLSGDKNGENDKTVSDPASDEFSAGVERARTGASSGVAKAAAGLAVVAGNVAGRVAISNVAVAIANVTHYDAIRQENKRLEDGNIHKSAEVEKYAGAETSEVLQGLFEKGRGDPTAVAKVAGAVANIFCIFPDEAKKNYGYFNSEEAREVVAESLMSTDKGSEIGSLCRIMNACHGKFEERSFLSREGLVDKILGSYDGLEPRSRADALTFLKSSLKDSVDRGDEGVDITDKLASEEFLNKILDSVDSSKKEDPGQDTFFEEMALNMSLEILRIRPELAAGKAGERVKDSIADFSQRAQGRRGVQNCCAFIDRACDIVGKSADGGEDEAQTPLLSNEEARDLLVDMGKRLEEPRELTFVCNSFSRATARLSGQSKKGIFDQDRDGGFLSDMIAKAGNARGNDGDVARGSVARVIGTLAADTKGREALCKNQNIHDLVIDWGSRAQSDEGIAGIAGAISQLAYQEAKQYQAPERAAVPLFAQNEEIGAVLDKMEGVHKARKEAVAGEEAEVVAAPDKVEKALENARGNVLRGLPAARVQMSPSDVRAGINREDSGPPVNASGGAGSSEIDRSSGKGAGNIAGTFQAMIDRQREEEAKAAGNKRSADDRDGVPGLGKRVKTAGPVEGQDWKGYVTSKAAEVSGRGGGAGSR